MYVRVLPYDVSQDPQLDQPAHHSHPPVPHQHLARGLVLKEEVGEGVGDVALHLLSVTDPQRGGSLFSLHVHVKNYKPENSLLPLPVSWSPLLFSLTLLLLW